MKSFIYSLLFFTICLFSVQTSKACYATFTHTNACAGDTVWFTALDLMALQSWDFGDSTSGVANMSHDSITYHVYSQPGTYNVIHFVNIGAEWAYQIQTITIGTNCFDANFTTTCSGSYIYFNNQSVGSGLSYSWNFGDPSSGVNNTDITANPSHNFASNGNYTVTLTISNGTQSDSYTKTINVNAASCFNLSINDMFFLPCIGDSVAFYGGPQGTYPIVLWNFGDPASGINNIATGNMNVKHVFSAPGNYTITLIASNGTLSDTVTNIYTVVDCAVWSGDANKDGWVNEEDIFPMGIYYNGQGIARANASSNWVGQACADWNIGFGGMYLDDMVNHKHADANGDGTINSLDVAAVNTNFGKNHLAGNFSSNTESFMIPRPNSPWLTFSVPNGIFTNSQWIEIPIMLGDANLPLNKGYGFASQIHYNANLVEPGSLQVLYNNSWLVEVDSMLHIEKDMNGVLHLAAVRTTKQDVPTGNGEICRLKFKTAATGNGTLHFDFSPSTKVISQFYQWTGGVEHFLNVQVGNAAAIVVNNTNAIADKTDADIRIYPTLASESIHIQSDNRIEKVILSDLQGKKILESTPFNFSTDIKVTTIENGLYLIAVKTEKGTKIEKVLIQK